MEVVPGGRAGARHDADAQRHRAERAPPVGVERAVGGEPAQHLLALLGEVAEREARVEVGHLQAELATRRVVVEVAEDAHLHPVAEPQPVLLQQRAQAHPGVGEELDPHHGLTARGVVGEREVGVAAALVPPLDLAAHPDAVAERAPQRPVHGVGELADRERRVGGVVERLVAEVEGRLAGGGHRSPILSAPPADRAPRRAPPDDRRPVLTRSCCAGRNTFDREPGRTGGRRDHAELPMPTPTPRPPTV